MEKGEGKVEAAGAWHTVPYLESLLVFFSVLVASVCSFTPARIPFLEHRPQLHGSRCKWFEPARTDAIRGGEKYIRDERKNASTRVLFVSFFKLATRTNIQRAKRKTQRPTDIVTGFRWLIEFNKRGDLINVGLLGDRTCW